MPISYRTRMAQYAKRRESMQRLRAAGWTMQRIADRFGISRARVAQLLNGKPA